MGFQRIAAAAVTTALAASLVACGAAEDAANDAKAKASEAAASAANKAEEKASEKANDALDSAKAKGGALAGSAYEDVLGKLSPEQQAKLKGLDAVALGKNGELAEDADSLTAANYYGARQAAVPGSGEDLTDLNAVAAGPALKEATLYIQQNAGSTPKFAIAVVSSDAGTVNLCVGPEGKNSRTLTVKDGKVVKAAQGTHAC